MSGETEIRLTHYKSAVYTSMPFFKRSFCGHKVTFKKWNDKIFVRLNVHLFKFCALIGCLLTI